MGSAGLVMIGAGFAGLWTAVRAKECNPNLDVLLLIGGVHRTSWQAAALLPA
ncbi:hypothetical protein SMC26_08250 [Actinomadura fulvescens]|uniref:Uncharacterized protein n=1 Tax=Actinomadura fulvescens TaxID=46160 RepID=A0ABP6DBW6_9ACTN